VERPDGKRALGWDDDIKMDLQEVGCALTELFWLRVRTSGGAYECANEPWVMLNARSFLTC
jgi:hypothetical protein